jgi:serine/threonine protein kinase/Flp pilus assembly protein TadD
MPGPDWENLKQIFHSALILPAEERAAYLDQACDGDLSLRRRVEELLQSHEETGNFVDAPAFRAAAEMLIDGAELKAGSRVAHYRIFSLLGEGGMGRVYLAEDTKLHRKVSLKFLSADVTKDLERLRRFEQEARAASALNQPNIITIHEIGEEDGHQFIATEFIDGQTLRERLRSPLDLDESLEIAIQVASALVAAHRVNIVHRDIKPENIMIRKDDGLVKVLDFGLAKMSVPGAVATGSFDGEADTLLRNTAPGVVMGTVAYMSPEQARGESVDERTDIWSLGVVLYEMVAGCSPFVASTSNEIISAILSKEAPAPLTRYSNVVPERLEEIVEKALTKNKDERYQTSKDLLIDLKRLQQTLQLKAVSERNTSPDRIVSAATNGQAVVSKAETSAASTPQASSAEYIVNQVRSHKRAALTGAILVLLIAAGVFIYIWRNRQIGAPSQPEIKSLAVLPLNNLSGDSSQEYFADGMTEALISNLAQIRALKVIPRTSAMRYKGSNKSLPEIARELKVDALIEGSVQRSGGRVQVTARLIPASAESLLWSRDYDRDLSDILKLQSDVSRAIADEIRIQVTTDERARLAAARSVNPQAHDAYLLGRSHIKRNEDDLSQAIQYFERAIQLSPDYAAAHAGLSDAWLQRGIWGTKKFGEVEPPARAAALKAVELDPQLAEAHASLSRIKSLYDWDWTGAEKELKRALELNPGSLYTHSYYADLLMSLGRHTAAIDEIGRVEQLDPLSSETQSSFGRILYRARKYEEAIPHLKRALELEPRNYSAYVRLGDVYAKLGRYDEAITVFEKAAQIRSDGMHAPRIARIYALMGKHREARQLLTGVKAGAFDIAAVYVALGDMDEAFRILEKAIEDRNSLLVYLKEDPSFENLHSDPRWKQLLRRMNFPQD